MSEGNERVTKKVILLYIADRLAGLTQDEFMDIAIDTIYMDYFEFSHIYDQLLHDNFLQEETRDDEQQLDADGVPTKRVDITPAGKQILGSLYNGVPLPIRNHLQQLTDDSMKAKTKAESVKASYFPDMDGSYRVHLQLKDDQMNSLLDLSFTVPSREMAVQTGENWEHYYAELYPKILGVLASKQKADVDEHG